MEFHQIEAAVTVVQTGSFRAAAEKLNKAQSAISHAIQSLEDQLGVKIFDRSTYRPQLNPAGKSLYPQFLAVLQQLQTTQSQARFLKSGYEPKLTLAVSALWPERALVEVLQNFTLQFPFTELILLEEVLSADELLIEGAADIALGEIFDEQDLFEKRPLGTIPMWSVAKNSIPAHELKQHRQIVVKNTLEKSQRLADVQPGQPQIRVTSLNLKKQLILCGVGWGGLPQHQIQNELKAKKLTALRRKPNPVPIHLAWLRKNSLGPGAQFLISALEAKKIKT
ncbi:MAG: LysR family transcriptional regulator [Bdellovibrionales bacterium]